MRFPSCFRRKRAVEDFPFSPVDQEGKKCYNEHIVCDYKKNKLIRRGGASGKKKKET